MALQMLLETQLSSPLVWQIVRDNVSFSATSGGPHGHIRGLLMKILAGGAAHKRKGDPSNVLVPDPEGLYG